jgi:hypothetical protein
MGRVVTVPIALGVTKAVQIDRETFLMSACAAVTGTNLVVVSTDPALTAANITGAPAASASITGDILTIIVPNSASFSQNLKIPLAKASTIYVASSAATWVFLLFEDAILAEILVT